MNNPPLGILSNQFLHEARNYLNAADILIGKGSNELNPPVYFLMCHGLELLLKAYVMARGVSYEEALKLGHDLQKAHEKAVSLGLPIEGEHTRALIEKLSEFHTYSLFRYPVVRKDDGHLILRGALVYPVEVLKIIETIFLRINGPVIMARLDATRHGSFPVETWHMGGPADEQS